MPPQFRQGYRLPEVLAERIDALTDSGVFVSKSEALRAVVMAGLTVMDPDFDWKAAGLEHPLPRRDPWNVKHDTTS